MYNWFNELLGFYDLDVTDAAEILNQEILKGFDMKRFMMRIEIHKSWWNYGYRFITLKYGVANLYIIIDF